MFEFCNKDCAPESERNEFTQNIWIYYNNPDAQVITKLDNSLSIKYHGDRQSLQPDFYNYHSLQQGTPNYKAF